MNKPTKREGFVTAEPVEDSPVIDTGPVIENEPEPPPPLPPAEPYAETWPVKVKLLHKAVRGPKGDMLKELSFREPTGGDVNRYGNPCIVDQNGDVIIIDRKMMTMMAALSGVLQPFLEAMDTRDYNSCAYRLRGFFIPNLASW
jgi:Phage tail assembly chaperone proteins, E, or 41 or 14